MTSTLEQMADEFCRWPLPDSKGVVYSPGATGASLLTHAEALTMFTKIVGPKIAKLEAENMCDACAGTGTPVSGVPCMCGGTGKMSSAARYLRERLVDTQAELAEARRVTFDPKVLEQMNALEAENARLRAAFEKPVVWMDKSSFWMANSQISKEELVPLFTKPEGLK